MRNGALGGKQSCEKSSGEGGEGSTNTQFNHLDYYDQGQLTIQCQLVWVSDDNFTPAL